MAIDEFENIFKQLKSDAEKAENDLNSILAKISTLQEIVDELTKALSNMEYLVNATYEPEYLANILFQLSIIIKENATNSLVSNATDAADSSEEYSRQPLRDLLLLACRNAPIEIKVNRAGWNSTIKATVDLDSSAGTLDSWARAVSEARNLNNWNKTKDPIQASAIWRDSIFKHSNAVGKKGKRFVSADLWKYTIDERLGLSGGVAPFWKLLNNGNFTSMSSDRGGFPYPVNRPTFFVERTQDELEFTFRNSLKSAREDYMIFRNRILSTHNNLLDLKNYLEARISELENELTEGDDLPVIFEPGLKRIERLQQKVVDVAKAYGLPAVFTHSPKFASIVFDIEEFGKVINSKVTKEGRVELTMNNGYRFRIYVNKLKRAVAGVK
jgi:hypothetical protein